MVLTRHHLIVALVLTCVVAGAVIVDWLVVTDRERIEGVIEDMASAVERSDTAALFEHVSPGYREQGMSPASLRILLEMFFRMYGPVRVNVRETRVTREGNLATVRVTVGAVSEARADVSGRSVWEVSMRKETDGVWRVTRIVPVRIRGRDVSGWDDVSGNL